MLDARTACQSDDLADTVSYADVYDCLANLMRTAADNLIEHLAERIATEILTTFARVRSVCVTVKKPDAPIDGDFDWMGVQIVRTRQSAFDEQNRSWRTAWLGLGSNLGDRAAYLRQACARLEDTPGVRLLAVSSLYETDPVGVTEQPLFLNAVCKVETCLTPTELLACCQAIENEHGRVRDMRWGPRTLDIDVLGYDGVVSDDPYLMLPHPEAARRAFVVQPLLEIVLGGASSADGVRIWQRDWYRSIEHDKLGTTGEDEK